MQNRWLLNILLVLIVLSLATIALLKWKANAPMSIEPLIKINKDQVQKISISYAKSDIVLAKQQRQWQIITPLQLPANQFRIDNILQFLTTKHYVQLKPPINLEELELEQPIIQLTVDGIKLGLGRKSPFNDNDGRRYVLLNGKVYLAIDTISYFLTGDATLFASLSPLGEQAVITKLKLPNLLLQKQDQQWKLLTPVNESIDGSADAIYGLVKAWQDLQAFSVRHYEPKPALEQIEITLMEEQILQFTVIAKEPEFILAYPAKKVQYQIGSEQVAQLFLLPEKNK